jgi:hypothetical protein
MPADKKRREPADVEPVRHGGLRYEAPLMGGPFGFAQDGGVVIARDDVTGDLVWAQRVYVVTCDDDIEDDKQEVYIKSLALTDDQRTLRVVNERGERFHLSIVDRSIERLGRE